MACRCTSSTRSRLGSLVSCCSPCDTSFRTKCFPFRGQTLRVTFQNGCCFQVAEGVLINCQPSFIVLLTADGQRVTIFTTRICRVEVICTPEPV
jgi:hypothetical protein